jgi:hypothetical protein
MSLLQILRAGLCLAAFVAAAPAQADGTTTLALERTLEGHWRGALEYRDYQSNQAFELPMDTAIANGPDGVTVTRVTSFDDGPKAGLVYITTVSLFDATGGQATSGMFRKGRAVDTCVGADRNLTHL